MRSFVSPRTGRCRHILVVLAITLLFALSTVFVLSVPGCGEKKAAVETGEKQKEANGEVEKEKEEPSNSKVEEDGETVELDWEYTNDIHGFSVSYPDGLECEDLEEGNGCSIADPNNDLFVARAWANPDKGLTAVDWCLKHYLTVSDTYDAVWAPAPENRVYVENFEGAQYSYYLFTYEVSGASYFYELMVMVKGGKVYFFTAQYPLDQVKEICPIVTAMIDSFTLPADVAGQ